MRNSGELRGDNMGFRKDFLDCLEGKAPEHFPLTEYMMFWPECDGEYLPKMGGKTYSEYFGVQTILPVPCDFNPYPLFEEKILGEDERHITKTDALGITCTVEKNSSAMPHYIEFPIKDSDSFHRYAERLDAACEQRFAGLKAFDEWQKTQDRPTQLTARGIFAFFRDFIKFDDLMFLFCDEPDLIAEMAQFHGDFLLKLWGRALDFHVPDIVYFGEDMAYKSGPMISPAMVREFIFPHWKRVIAMLKSRGVKHIICDSDGNVMPILDLITEAGFTCILPLERAAGMDGEVVREKYPTLGMIGGVDKLELAKGDREIRREAEKAARLYRAGRYIPSCDHSVPPIVPFENYAAYIRYIKEYCQ